VRALETPGRLEKTPKPRRVTLGRASGFRSCGGPLFGLPQTTFRALVSAWSPVRCRGAGAAAREASRASERWRCRACPTSSVAVRRSCITTSSPWPCSTPVTGAPSWWWTMTSIFGRPSQRCWNRSATACSLGRLPDAPELSVIVITASTRLLPPAFPAPVRGVLTKPFDIEDLLAAVGRRRQLVR